VREERFRGGGEKRPNVWEGSLTLVTNALIYLGKMLWGFRALGRGGKVGEWSP